MKEKYYGYIFVGPAFLYLICLMMYPVFNAIFLSLTDKQIGIFTYSFIGFRNYIELFNISLFQTALINTGILVGVTVFVKYSLGLLFAITIINLKKGFQAIRSIILIPWIIPISLSVLIWKWMFDANFSVVNYFLSKIGLSAVSWLGSPVWARISVMIVNIWMGLPFFTIMLSVGLLTIPKELYEAAEIDGANGFYRFLNITLPQLKSVTLVVLLYSIVMTAGAFEIVYILTKGGPMQSTHLLGTMAYEWGFKGLQLGKASAISLFIFPVLFVCVYFSLKNILKEGSDI